MSGIVVGIDGSPAAEAALAHALEEAKLRRLPLRIVCAWQVPPIEYAGAAFATVPDLSIEAEHHADEILAGAVASIGPDPGIHVETVAVQGPPAPALLELARDATLVVVGTRGRNALASIVLGSVSQAVLHHCPTPVVVVPVPTRDAEGTPGG